MVTYVDAKEIMILDHGFQIIGNRIKHIKNMSYYTIIIKSPPLFFFEAGSLYVVLNGQEPKI